MGGLLPGTPLLLAEWPMSVAELAGDFLTFCGDDRGPWGEKAVCWCWENGVDTGGVAAAGVRPCCDGASFIAVGVAIVRGSIEQGIVGKGVEGK